MAKITKPLNEWAFPPICAACQAKAEVPYLLECRTGIDLFSFQHITIVRIPIPLCTACNERRGRIGWNAVAVCVIGIVLGIAFCVWGPRDHQGDIELYAIGTGIAIVMGLIWYGRNSLRRDLDRWVLGVAGKKFKQSTNELTIWFRDSADSMEKSLAERFVADPAQERRTAPPNSEFAAKTASIIDQRNREIEKHRAEILAQVQATRYRMQVPRRPLLIAGVVLCYFLTWHFNATLPEEVKRRGERQLDPRLLCISMAFIGTVILGFVGLTISVGGDLITRSFWGLKKSLDRTTSTVHTYGSNYYKIVDASGKKLVVSNQLANHELLLEECELRAGAVHQ